MATVNVIQHIYIYIIYMCVSTVFFFFFCEKTSFFNKNFIIIIIIFFFKYGININMWGLKNFGPIEKCFTFFQAGSLSKFHPPQLKAK